MIIDELQIQIRTAEESDWQAIIDIYNQAVDETGKTADTEHQSVESRMFWLSQHLTKKYPILVVEVDSQIIGWCSLSQHRPGRQALEITAEISYYIDKEHRQKGIGKLLINKALETAAKNGIKNVFAILLDINELSTKILKDFGFEEWGHLPKVAEINGQTCGQLIYGKHL